jgi:hypothetical protein
VSADLTVEIRRHAVIKILLRVVSVQAGDWKYVRLTADFVPIGRFAGK